MLREVEAYVTKHEKAANAAEQQATKLRQSAERAWTAELNSAMNPAEVMKQIIGLARSYHMQAGRHAIDDNAPVSAPYVSIRGVLATDTSAIDEARKRV